MEEQMNILELVPQPGFCVRDGQISHVNQAAQVLMLSAGQEIVPLLHTGSEEYARLEVGPLYLSLKLGETVRNASVTRMAEGDLFLLGKKELSIVGSLCYILGGVVLLAAPLGILPVSEGNTGLDLIIYIVAQLIMSLGLGIYSTVSWAMMGDAIDYNEWKTGNREEGIVYSLHSFFRKLAQGVGPALAVAIMAGNGYVNNSNPDANGVFQSIDVTLLGWDFAVWCRGLIAIMFLVAGAMMFIGLGVVYNLDKKTLNQMQEELAARKK